MYPTGNQYKSFSFYTENGVKAVALKRFLKKNKIWYEPSECGNGVYFSIKCTEEQRHIIDEFLDKN